VNPHTGDIATIIVTTGQSTTPANIDPNERVFHDAEAARVAGYTVAIPAEDEARVRAMNRAQKRAWAREQLKKTGGGR
jgi:hypothetical protein